MINKIMSRAIVEQEPKYKALTSMGPVQQHRWHVQEGGSGWPKSPCSQMLKPGNVLGAEVQVVCGGSWFPVSTLLGPEFSPR